MGAAYLWVQLCPADSSKPTSIDAEGPDRPCLLSTEESEVACRQPAADEGFSAAAEGSEK